MNLSTGPGGSLSKKAPAEFIGRASDDFTDLFKKDGSKKTYEAHALQTGMFVALGVGFLLKSLLSR